MFRLEISYSSLFTRGVAIGLTIRQLIKQQSFPYYPFLSLLSLLRTSCLFFFPNAPLFTTNTLYLSAQLLYNNRIALAKFKQLHI